MNKVDSQKKPSAVALGMFDGLHIGHRAVLSRAVSLADENGWQSVAYTFENHPRSVFAEAPAPLMTAEQRKLGMEALGIDEVDMVHFDKAMAALSPEAFLTALCARYDLRALIAGSDFTFGCRGAGTVQTLREYAPKFGYEVYEIPFVMLEGEKVSSTRIRRAIENGDAELVSAMLGK